MKPKPPKKTDRLLVCSPATFEAHARAWFMAGFKHSGEKFHGECIDIDAELGLRRLMNVEFERLWAQRSDKR